MEKIDCPIDCPICGFNCTKMIHRDTILQEKYYCSYNYSLCKICGFVFQQRRHERSHYETLPYQTQEDYDDHSKRRASYILNFCWEFLFDTSLLISPKILDIGCGRGGVMKNIKTLMPLSEITGYTLDMGEEEATDLKIIYRNIEDPPDDESSENYDIIIMSHVVEHLYDLNTAMKNVHSLLNDDGLLYIEVPSFHWCEVRSPSVWAPEHLSYFTKTSLANILRIHNFKIMKIKESRYWGNIKIVARKKNFYDGLGECIWIPVGRSPEESDKYQRQIAINRESGTIINHHIAKLMHPYYRLKTKIVKPGANE